MTATNHALAGALIGLSVGQPWLAIPASFLSHFVCDAIPHFGFRQTAIGSKLFRNVLLADVTLCVLLVVALVILQPSNWFLAAVCAFVATSPDLMWLKKFRQARQGKTISQDKSIVRRFHAGIQWFEKPIGLAVEAVWAVSAIILLKVYII